MTHAFGSGVFLDCSFVHIFVTDVVVTDVDAAVAVFLSSIRECYARFLLRDANDLWRSTPLENMRR